MARRTLESAIAMARSFFTCSMVARASLRVSSANIDGLSADTGTSKPLSTKACKTLGRNVKQCGA